MSELTRREGIIAVFAIVAGVLQENERVRAQSQTVSGSNLAWKVSTAPMDLSVSLSDLPAGTGFKRVLVSYNSETVILTAADIFTALKKS